MELFNLLKPDISLVKSPNDPLQRTTSGTVMQKAALGMLLGVASRAVTIGVGMYQASKQVPPQTEGEDLP